MALSRAQAETQWAAENPQQDGESAEAYADRVADFGNLLMLRSIREDDEAVIANLRKKYVAGQAMMDAILALPAVPTGTMTTAQLSTVARTMDGAIRDLARFNKGLLDALKAARVLLDGG